MNWFLIIFPFAYAVIVLCVWYIFKSAASRVAAVKVRKSNPKPFNADDILANALTDAKRDEIAETFGKVYKDANRFRNFE